eukprot:459511-Lingulodinium_polyedra.AAC.1
MRPPSDASQFSGPRAELRDGVCTPSGIGGAGGWDCVRASPREKRLRLHCVWRSSQELRTEKSARW